MMSLGPLPETSLPRGVRSRFLDGVNGLRMHILEAGFGDAPRPMVLLLHGFPELAFSWRKVMGRLASAGYHVVAPDQRGYGRTTGWSADYAVSLEPFRLTSIAADATALVAAMGRQSVAAVIGHDFGSLVAARCALARPDVFRAVVMMSAPFGGIAKLPLAGEGPAAPTAPPNLHAELANLPRPRRHYAFYYSRRQANADMLNCPQGLPAFLRAYYHAKSADWPGNAPHPLQGQSAQELAKLPTYYMMDLGADMPATVASAMPSPAEIAACRWLSEAELQVYAGEFARTGFQGGLNWYRGVIDPANRSDALLAGRTIDVPATFIAGRSDWGLYQRPGELEAMRTTACTRLQGLHVIPDAGHWVQQEQSEAVGELVNRFLAGLR